MTQRLDTLLLLALPASGKSEVRRYLSTIDPVSAERDFGLGPTVQLDDYPYVHMMRRIDEEIRGRGGRPAFFASNDEPFLDGRDWATLIELMNQDYGRLGSPPLVPAAPAAWLMDRIDRARSAIGAPPPFDGLEPAVVASMAAALDEEAAGLASDLGVALGSFEPGVSTVVIEFARGGPEGTVPPLPEPYGYRSSLSYLSKNILRRAAALYVWVTPEESRRRNLDRARPGPEGDASILHHGVPEQVMREDYGVDDFLWLLAQRDDGTIGVEADGATFSIPAAVFDNRTDLTSFLRADPESWDRDDVARLHGALAAAFGAVS